MTSKRYNYQFILYEPPISPYTNKIRLTSSGMKTRQTVTTIPECFGMCACGMDESKNGEGESGMVKERVGMVRVRVEMVRVRVGMVRLRLGMVRVRVGMVRVRVGMVRVRVGMVRVIMRMVRIRVMVRMTLYQVWLCWWGHCEPRAGLLESRLARQARQTRSRQWRPHSCQMDHQHTITTITIHTHTFPTLSKPTWQEW